MFRLLLLPCLMWWLRSSRICSIITDSLIASRVRTVFLAISTMSHLSLRPFPCNNWLVWNIWSCVGLLLVLHCHPTVELALKPKIRPSQWRATRISSTEFKWETKESCNSQDPQLSTLNYLQLTSGYVMAFQSCLHLFRDSSKEAVKSNFNELPLDLSQESIL